MAVQDLTPQLRTRLSRVEKLVGLFVSMASLLLLAGFAYYVYNTGQRKGWWVDKYPYYTLVSSGAGLRIGTPVRLFGFDAGEVTEVEAMQWDQLEWGNVYVAFKVRHPYEGYIGKNSRVKLAGAGFLGDRYLEILPSTPEKTEDKWYPTYKTEKTGVKILDVKTEQYTTFKKGDKGFWLLPDEAPAVTEQVDAIMAQVKAAMPAILDLTNQLSLVLSNVASLTAEGQKTINQAGPLLSNVTAITETLKDPNGSLGTWLIPTNLNTQIETTLVSLKSTLTNADVMMLNTDSNITKLATGLDPTLVNVADMTSNLNQQVQSNTNLVKGISDLIINADTMVQGLKTHWLLRSAFKNKEEPESGEQKQKQRPRTPAPKAGKWR